MDDLFCLGVVICNWLVSNCYKQFGYQRRGSLLTGYLLCVPALCLTGWQGCF